MLPCIANPRYYNGVLPVSQEMEASVSSVEKIVGYKFKDRRLLEEALTHPSYNESANYQRLEFIGDAALGCSFSNYVFLAYPELDPGQLSLLKSANISTEKFARVAIRHGLYRYLRHNVDTLDEKVMEFAVAVGEERVAVPHGGYVKAPKVLADIVESVAAAIYVDCGFDLHKLWVIFRGLLEPIVTLEDLQKEPQPVTMLFELCQKEGKKVNIKHSRKGENNIANVYVDGKVVASTRTHQKETAKLDVARQALQKLIGSKANNIKVVRNINVNGKCEIDEAKRKLHELCLKNKWAKPVYRIQKEVGPPHDRKFISAVRIRTKDGILVTNGDVKSRLKNAENSAASLMLSNLLDSKYL